MYTKFETKTKANASPGLFFCKTIDKVKIKLLLTDTQGWEIVSETDKVEPSEQGKTWLITSALYAAHSFDSVKLTK